MAFFFFLEKNHCFPVCHRSHFFLLCFNLRDDQLKIIDNMITRTTIKIAYGEFLEKLVTFKNYTFYHSGNVITF